MSFISRVLILLRDRRRPARFRPCSGRGPAIRRLPLVIHTPACRSTTDVARPPSPPRPPPPLPERDPRPHTTQLRWRNTPANSPGPLLYQRMVPVWHRKSRHPPSITQPPPHTPKQQFGSDVNQLALAHHPEVARRSFAPRSSYPGSHQVAAPHSCSPAAHTRTTFGEKLAALLAPAALPSVGVCPIGHPPPGCRTCLRSWSLQPTVRSRAVSKNASS